MCLLFFFVSHGTPCLIERKCHQHCVSALVAHRLRQIVLDTELVERVHRQDDDIVIFQRGRLTAILVRNIFVCDSSERVLCFADQDVNVTVFALQVKRDFQGNHLLYMLLS